MTTSTFKWLYAEGYVHQWCGYKDPRRVQLLIDTLYYSKSTVNVLHLAPCHKTIW